MKKHTLLWVVALVLILIFAISAGVLWIQNERKQSERKANDRLAILVKKDIGLKITEEDVAFLEGQLNNVKNNSEAFEVLIAHYFTLPEYEKITALAEEYPVLADNSSDDVKQVVAAAYSLLGNSEKSDAWTAKLGSDHTQSEEDYPQ